MEFLFLSEDNISRSIDILAKKEYNYEYEDGRIVRATEADIELSGEIVTSKVRRLYFEMVELKNIIIALLYILLSFVFLFIAKRRSRLVKVFIGALFILICLGSTIIFDFSQGIDQILTICSTVLFLHLLEPGSTNKNR